jgi:hypothetical protein
MTHAGINVLGSKTGDQAFAFVFVAVKFGQD